MRRTRRNADASQGQRDGNTACGRKEDAGEQPAPGAGSVEDARDCADGGQGKGQPEPSGMFGGEHNSILTQPSRAP